ncbi:RraA family protein [Microbulbifer sp. GL-2]|uniref:RraA family protein n=1 Tax=Microbulbifer sp. GL-2 TaxID=2591606 RepID=UPI0011653C6B|nr:RraA family protein [Microbulbifer sp. GL-2]BBM02999.1 diguanylate cyclase [Microbulbifer sp. GL-2]
MIEDSPTLTLQRNFARPDKVDMSALYNTPTEFIVDCMDGRGSLHHAIKPLLPMESSIVGIAVTCECGPADNLGVLGALDIAQPGDIVVASTDSFMHTAVIGDLVLGMMKNKGVAGFVTDGLVRDLEGIKRLSLPVFCKGITPNSPARSGPATAGLPVNLDSMHISSGDIIVADQTGVVVVPLGQLNTVKNKIDRVKSSEATLQQAVESGLILPPFYKEIVDTGKVIELTP